MVVKLADWNPNLLQSEVEESKDTNVYDQYFYLP